MGKPKDAKIWNEDLARALDARHQKAQREGKRDVHLWRTGRDQILAVRKDIYMYRSGNIVNLPNNLKKTVQRLCEDVIRGVKNVYPDGHVPTGNASTPSNPSTPARVASHTTNNNPFANDHYMKKIAIRGGAFAILMAFRYSVTEILTKRDICREAQKFCDSEMDSNYHAGRMYGAWKSIDTLKSRNFVKEQGYKTYTPNGFRDRPHTYSLTRDGEMFIDALLAKRPEALEAAKQAAGRDPRRPFGVESTPSNTPSSLQTPVNFLSPIRSGCSHTNKIANMGSDRAQLEEWIATANVGDRKEFKVGRERRFQLHKLCDAIQRQNPGLLLTHGSSGNARGRTLSIQLVSKPLQSKSTPMLAKASTPKRPHSPSWFDSEEHPETAPSSSYSESGVSARKRAGLAAIKRQEEALEEIQLKTAILESKKMTPQRRQQQQQQGQFHTPINDDDSDLKKAIQASLRDTKRKAGIKRNIFATVDSTCSSSSDDELPGPFLSPKRKRQKTTPLPEKDKKLPAKKTAREIFCIDSDDEKDNLPRKLPAISPKHAARRKYDSAKIAAKKRRGLPKEAPTPSSINLCESSDDEKFVEIRENIGETIDLSNSQLSQDPDFIQETMEEPIDLSNSQLSQDPDFVDNDTNNGDSNDDDVIIVEDTAPKESTARITSPNRRFPGKDNSDLKLTVLIDNRERNRNATPRTLRNELTRHLSTGPLSNVWPRTLPPAQVEEAKLDWGDIQYSVRSSNSDPLFQKKLGVSIERKRVNDLVQRSSDGDHFRQLYHMKQHCSLSVLLIENDTRTAQNVTPYNAQDKEEFDPFDTTIRCEDDVYRMFGRILLTCDSVKFLQTRDEQASLRSIGALGLMSVFAPSRCIKKLEDSLSSKERANKNSIGVQALSDQLKEAGIPWRMAKRVANVIGGPIELKALYDSCCNEEAKSLLLSHTIAIDDQGDLRSSSSGWSDAIYRIVAASFQSSSSEKTELSGEAALLLHKELIDDHGMYLSTLYQGHSPEESLEKVLDNLSSSSAMNNESATRHVAISLSQEQATKYFSATGRSTIGDKTFYKLSILSEDQSRRQSGAITMRTASQSALASKPLLIYEMEGSDFVNLVRDNWGTDKKKNFVSLAKNVASRLDDICREQSRGQSCGSSSSSNKKQRILMVCGLQPALDANAKKSGYAIELKTVIDLVFAELLLCYDIVILQALRKNSDDRVNLVKQLALSCFHCGFLTQIYCS